MRRLYRSVTTQTLHYLARPHEGTPEGPVRSAAAWTRAELEGDRRWAEVFSDADRRVLDDAVAHARATGKSLGSLRAEDLPLPGFADRIARWRRGVAEGVGVQVLEGVPVERWSDADCERFFWCFGQHLGRPGAQNRDGELLGHVRDVGASYDDPATRGYKTSAALSYHCDAADAVGLLCLRAARRGGRSRFVSSVAVFNELLAREPALARRLFEPFVLDTRGDGGVDYFAIAPCRYGEGVLRTFYHGDYFRTFEQHPGAPKLSRAHREALDAYDAIANREDLYVEMDLAPGTVQLLSNHTVLHARGSYEDWDEPEKKRHLLRLWLSFDAGRSPRAHASRAASLVTLLAELARGRARAARRSLAR